MRQGCTLFNIYINQLANILEHAPIQGLTLHDTEIKCLLYADDLVLLSPTEEGLQDSLNLLEDFCQSWALTVNLQKTRVMMFQKRSRSQGPTHTFTLAHRTIETTKTYTYLGLKITPTGNFTLAVNELKEKAQRAFYAIKRSIQIDIPIQIWLKLFKAVIEPIALYGSEVWGPSIKFDFLNWEKHPIKTLHLDFCKRILRVQRKTPNNGCRAELGQYPLLLNIQKRAIKFWKHLKTSDPNTYHYKALKHQELSVSPLTVRLSEHSHTHTLTHTHTHMLGFHVLWGLSIDVMVFILYKLYILSPYTAPIPKPNHHRRHSAILHFQKTSLSLIYKLVSSWGPKNVPTRTRILDIAIVVGTFCPHNVGYT